MHGLSDLSRSTWSAALLVALGAILAGCGAEKASGRTAPPEPDRSEPAEPARSEPPERPAAPGGVVTAMNGEPFDLADVYADSRAYVIFYRGHW